VATRVRVLRTRTQGAVRRRQSALAAWVGRRKEGAKLRRKGILALAVVALLALGAGVAFAATKYSTKIDYLGNGGHGTKA
jgi:hypothetical protein